MAIKLRTIFILVGIISAAAFFSLSVFFAFMDAELDKYRRYADRFPLSLIKENCPEGALSLHMVDDTIVYVSIKNRPLVEGIIGNTKTGIFFGCRTKKEWLVVGTSIRFVQLSPTLTGE